jgi:hypothetical protein
MECLGAKETNRRLGNVISFDGDGMFMAMFIKNVPMEQTFTRNCVDTGEVLNLGRTGGVTTEVCFAWAGAARCPGVHDKRLGDVTGGQGKHRFKENWKRGKTGAVRVKVDRDSAPTRGAR